MFERKSYHTVAKKIIFKTKVLRESILSQNTKIYTNLTFLKVFLRKKNSNMSKN